MSLGCRCKYLPDGLFHIHESMQHVSILPLEPHNGTEERSPGEGEMREEERDEEGILGRIITTNLNRTLMPVIRYAIGDMGRLVRRRTRCPCGRTLRVLELRGRCDARVRINAEDLLVDHVAAAVARVEGLSMHFQIHVAKTERHWDQLTILVEGPPVLTLTSLEAGVERIGGSSAEAGKGGQEHEGDVDDNRGRQVLVALAREWARYEQAACEPVLVRVVPLGAIPRNPRTGKISLVLDSRAKS